jgi:hypothetical protein
VCFRVGEVCGECIIIFTLYEGTFLTDALQYPFLFLFLSNPFLATYIYKYIDIYTTHIYTIGLQYEANDLILPYYWLTCEASDLFGP